MGKSKLKRLGKKVPKPGSLTDQITNEEYVLPAKRKKKQVDIEEDVYVEGSLGQSIMKQSLAQLQEIEEEDNEEWPALGAPVKRNFQKEEKPPAVKFAQNESKQSFQKMRRSKQDKEFSSDDEDIGESKVANTTNVSKIIDDFAVELEVDDGDFDILEHFKKEHSTPQQRLADIFKDKITEMHTEIQTEVDAESNFGGNLPPALQELCKETGKILARYRSGTLPKIFKTFPSYGGWEEMLYLTNPDKWTAAAMYQATIYFISSLRASMAQRFVSLVLLPRVRDDISYYKRLNFHLYQALIKSLFKPGAFFKGLIFPLCESENCTLREAIIIGSVIAKNSIPIAHASAAIKTLAAMEFSGPTSIFLRILFDKKYALAYQVIDEVYEHFMRFHHEKRELPVLWHQSFLTFVQRYKNDLSQDQVIDLQRLLKVHYQPKISPEITRELINSTYRKSAEPMHVD